MECEDVVAARKRALAWRVGEHVERGPGADGPDPRAASRAASSTPLTAGGVHEQGAGPLEALAVLAALCAQQTRRKPAAQ